MFPQDFIDRVKEANDIVELVEEYTELKKVGPNIYEGHCPHPNHVDNDPSFRVWSDSQSWACMVCHCGKKNSKFKVYGSDCIAFIQWIRKMNWKDAITYLAERKHIPLPSQKNQYLLDEKKRLAITYSNNLFNVPNKAASYLQERGLTLEDCAKWGLGYDGIKIIFPLLDRYRNVLGFTKRWIEMPEGRNDKYKNSSTSPIFNKRKYFYGIHRLDDEFEEIRITEGSTDVILADKYGVKNIVATLGTAFTDEHVELIKHYKKIPVFCMDGDEAGRKSIEKSIDLLAKHNIYSKLLLLPDGMDMADLSSKLKDKTEQYIQDNAITYGNYLIQKELSKYTSKVNEIKLKQYPDVLKILAKLPLESERTILKSYVKKVMDIDM